MARIITVSREFGSGGRELGKRLADELGIAYYDREIVAAIAEQSNLNENFVDWTLESGTPDLIPLTFGRTFNYLSVIPSESTKILADQYRVITAMAEKGDAVFIGRHADVILEDYKPLKLFIYADMLAKIKRCRERAPEDEDLSDRDLTRKIRQVDKARRTNHSLVSDLAWGDKQGYHLMVNTTELNLETFAPVLANYVKYFFDNRL